MNKQNISKEINRLNFENIIWIIFAILSIANIIGDNNEKHFLQTYNHDYKDNANHIFELTITFTLIIYIYFLMRNYNAFSKCSYKEKSLYAIKVLGSSFLIAGSICLLYFQFKQKDFNDSPAL